MVTKVLMPQGAAVTGPDDRPLTDVLARLQSSLARLRAVEGIPALLAHAPREIVQTLGFTRSALFRVREARLVAEVVYFAQRPEWAAEILEFSRAHAPRLDHLLAETEMIRRRRPLLIADADGNPGVDPELRDAFQTRAYVAAPLIVGGQVAGFLHADRYFEDRAPNELDRDLVWAFAEGFGAILDHAVAQQLSRRQQEHIGCLVATVDEAFGCLTAVAAGSLEDVERLLGEPFGGAEQPPGGEIGRARAAVAPQPVARPGAQYTSRIRLDQLLTRRELEVLGLIATGATNSDIAERLVIAEGTVKSHVKHILRKTRSTNRAEAVSRYVRYLLSRQ